MQRTTLTAGLGVAAVAAVLLAPRLSAMVSSQGPDPAVAPVVTVEPVEAVIAQIESVPEVQAVSVVEPDRPRPRRVEPPVLPMGHGVAPSELIPELDQPQPRYVHVEPQPVIDTDYWDDCPACGMG